MVELVQGEDQYLPRKKLSCTIKLIINVETCRWRILSSIRVGWNLRSRRTMHINDDIEPSIRCPAADPLQILETSLGEVLTITVYKRLHHPVPNRDPYCIYAVALHLCNVALGDPSVPVVLKPLIGRTLTKSRDAVEFRVIRPATHIRPFSTSQPRLEDKEGAKVDSSDLA